MILRTRFLAVALCGISWAVSSLSGPTITVKGIVVAFHQQDRALKVKEARSLGDHIERWVFRVEKATSDGLKGLVLVLYAESGNGVSDAEINGDEWQLHLRQTNNKGLQGCVGKTFLDGANLQERPATVDDFAKTSFGTHLTLPDLNSLPCFVMVGAPVRVGKAATMLTTRPRSVFF